MEAPAAMLLLFTVAYGLSPLARTHFGQREHLMYILAVPYFLYSARKLEAVAEDARFTLALGALAGIGFALKPYFLLPWAGIQAYRLAVTRRWSALFCRENVAIVIINVGYGLLVLAALPDYLPIARMAMQVYPAFDSPLKSIFQHEIFLTFYALAALCVFVKPSKSFRDLRWVLFIVVSGFAASVVLQQKGLGYHYYPMRAAEVVLAGILLLDLLEARWFPALTVRWKYGLACMCMLALVSRAALQGFAALAMPRGTDRLLPVVQEKAPGQPILVLSTSAWSAFPLINYSGGTHTLRFSSLWILPGVYRDSSRPRPREAMDTTEKYLVDSLVADTEHSPPALVIVETGNTKPGFEGRDFDFLDYFLHDARFARIWEQYRFLEEVGNYRIFQRNHS